MEGQVVGRHPEGSGGSPASSALLSKPPLLPPMCCSRIAVVGCMQQQQGRCSSIGARLIAGQHRATGLSPSPAHALLLLCIYVAVASIGALLHKNEKKRQSVERRELSRELSARMTAVTFRAGSLLIPSSTHYYATDHTSASNCTSIIHTIL